MIYETSFEVGHLVNMSRICQEEDSKYGILKKFRSNALHCFSCNDIGRLYSCPALKPLEMQWVHPDPYVQCVLPCSLAIRCRVRVQHVAI